MLSVQSLEISRHSDRRNLVSEITALRLTCSDTESRPLTSIFFRYAPSLRHSLYECRCISGPAIGLFRKWRKARSTRRKSGTAGENFERYMTEIYFRYSRMYKFLYIYIYIYTKNGPRNFRLSSKSTYFLLFSLEHRFHVC